MTIDLSSYHSFRNWPKLLWRGLAHLQKHLPRLFASWTCTSAKVGSDRRSCLCRFSMSQTEINGSVTSTEQQCYCASRTKARRSRCSRKYIMHLVIKCIQMKTKNLNKHSVEIRVYRKESSLLVVNQTGVNYWQHWTLCWYEPTLFFRYNQYLIFIHVV